MTEAPLFRFNSERPYLVNEVTRRVYNEFLTASRQSEANALEYVLNETAYVEIDRLRTEQGPEEEIRDRGWWKSMARSLTHLSEDQKRDILRDLIESYTDDTAGKFDPQVFKLATGALPLGLSFLFRAQDVGVIPGVNNSFREGIRQLRNLGDRVVVEGHTDTMRKLAEIGTLVVVPTHSSNMDSIVMGWSLEHAGLPPVTYGAGKNLFTNPLTSFFMHNLGAYKVDRRIKHNVYKSILKSYSQVLLERGYHSLFFPGGTRCRSNIVESNLKLGLLGTAVSAYISNLEKGQNRPIFICPATINYNLVLEGESLIREHLRRSGRARYFLPDDEFNQISTIVRFVMNTVRMDSTTIIRYGQPMDVFGNRVEGDGESYDDRGRRIDATDFVRSLSTGDIVHDTQRDREYTRYTGKRIGESFVKNTVLVSSLVVAYALFELIRHRYPKLDVYQLMRLNFDETIPWHELRSTVGELVSEIRRLADLEKVHLAPLVANGSIDEIVDSGISTLTMYHVPAAVEYVPSGVRVNHTNLLYFYGNRVRTFDLDARELVSRALE